MIINRIQSIALCFAAVSLLVAACTLAGCSHSSSPQPNYDLTWKVPGVTSVYVETYSHGTLALGQQNNTDASYIVNASGDFDGKSNTITIINTRNNADKEYYAFESNGDYSVLDSATGNSSSDWRRYPTAQGAPINQTTDSIYLPDNILFFDTTHVHKEFTRSYVDVENITDTSKITYAAFKIHEVTVQVDSVMSFQHPSVPVTATYNTDYWIAPTIGWIVKDSVCDGTNWTVRVLDGCTVH